MYRKMDTEPETRSFKEKLKLLETQTSGALETERTKTLVRQKTFVALMTKADCPEPNSSVDVLLRNKPPSTPVLKPKTSLNAVTQNTHAPETAFLPHACVGKASQNNSSLKTGSNATLDTIKNVKHARKPMPLPKPFQTGHSSETQDEPNKATIPSNAELSSKPRNYTNVYVFQIPEDKQSLPGHDNKTKPIYLTASESLDTCFTKRKRNPRDDYEDYAINIQTPILENEDVCQRDSDDDYENSDFRLNAQLCVVDSGKQTSSYDESKNVLSLRQENCLQEISPEKFYNTLPKRDDSVQKVVNDAGLDKLSEPEESVKTPRGHDTAHIDLLLIGKTGNGKSALGNSILNRNAFVSKNSTSSVTKIVSRETSEVNGRIVSVVDGPGVGDTDLGAEQAQNLVIEALSSAVATNPRGFHAFLLVLKLGGRLTSEEMDTINFLKKILGKNFFRKFGILVMTCGDQLEKGTDFQIWVSKQEGVLSDLVKECNNRIILFDNKTEDKEEKEKQLNDLMRIIDHLVLENCRYSNEQFDLARSTRNAIILESKKPVIVEESMLEANLIMQGIESCQVDAMDTKSTIRLNVLLTRAKALHKKLIVDDKSTGVLREMISHVESVQNTIQVEIQLSQRLSEIYRKMEEKELQYSRDVHNKLGRNYNTLNEEMWRREMDDCLAKNQSLQAEKNRLFQQLKSIEHSNRETFLSKVQSKVSRAFMFKMKQKQKIKQKELHKNLDKNYDLVYI
ncbi:uncharacterized protein LOC106072365 isoform X3 [Biomphalaria glabrata]|uniref:Uncharacterized protein LOC106072365 isoform X3 n=1 Tax=Biomphalaria glabrata TaxID=6526 RepID=A0A9W2Z688_BIOGL|nr:uncharacterized protein LOC106072365 isoform X3 [Biomphalaria glabrata]